MAGNVDWIATILTSAVISSVVSLLLKLIFENRQKHNFSVEIERLKYEYEMKLEHYKADIALDIEVQQKIIKRRLESYPKLVELIYRSRNIARELCISNANTALADEIAVRALDIENLLYESRIDLQRDGLFAATHTYKNVVKTFSHIANDIRSLRLKDPQADIAQMEQDLKRVFDNIESMYSALVDDISVKSIHSVSVSTL